jgi:hypothetical protein
MELANETAKNTSVGNVDYDAVKKMLIDALDENKVYNLGYNTSVDIYTVNLDTQKGASIFTSYMSGISGDTYDIDEESSYYQGTTDYVESQKNKDYEAAFERISECLKSGSFGSIDITKTFYKIIVRVYAQDDVNGTEDRVYYYIFIQ